MRTERLRSPIWYYGGKGNMLAKLLPLVPPGGRPYCEPYCGGASLFFAREPAPVEVLNDLNGDVVNLFRCFQNPDTFEELRHRLMWTPYARAEFGRALDILNDPAAGPVDRAWAFFVAQNQGTCGDAERIGNWGRVFVSTGEMARNVNSWLMRLSMLDGFRWRLMRVQIDNRDALDVIRYWDNPDAVFYVDPPYHPDARKDRTVYDVEQDHEHHQRLVSVLLETKGAVTLSGYEHPVYQPLEAAGWLRRDWRTACYAAARIRNSGLQGTGAALSKASRTESVWLNPVAQKLLRITSEENRLL